MHANSYATKVNVDHAFKLFLFIAVVDELLHSLFVIKGLKNRHTACAYVVYHSIVVDMNVENDVVRVSAKLQNANHNAGNLVRWTPSLPVVIMMMYSRQSTYVHEVAVVNYDVAIRTTNARNCATRGLAGRAGRQSLKKLAATVVELYCNHLCRAAPSLHLVNLIVNDRKTVDIHKLLTIVMVMAKVVPSARFSPQNPVYVERLRSRISPAGLPKYDAERFADNC